MSAQDNQQVTSVGWFTGILEGEGNFDARSQQSTRIRIANTDLDIVEACEKFLKYHNIYSSTTSQVQRAGVKKIYCVTIQGNSATFFDYSRLLYNLIESSLQCRRVEYQQMLGTSETACDLSADINWLIGIWEAEGSFSLWLNNRGVIAMRISLVSTNERILQKAALSLMALGCSWNSKDSQRGHWERLGELTLNSLPNCLRFLRKTRGFWQSGRNIRRTELMVEYLESRLAKNCRGPYSDRELEIPELMRQLNHRGG